jgi:hypothetical protein
MVGPDFRAINSGQLSWESLSKNTITAFEQERYKNLAGFAQAKAGSRIAQGRMSSSAPTWLGVGAKKSAEFQ